MGNNQQKSSLKRHSVLYGHSNEYADDFESTMNESNMKSTTAKNRNSGRLISIGGGGGDRKSLTSNHLPTHLTITSSSVNNNTTSFLTSSPTTASNSNNNKRFTVSLGTPTKDKKQRHPNNDNSNSSSNHNNKYSNDQSSSNSQNSEKRFSLVNMPNSKKILDDRKSVSLSPSSTSIPKHKRLLQLSPNKSSLTSSVSTSPILSSSSNDDEDIFNNLNPSINLQEIIALLRDPRGMQLFYDFCEQQLCTENIELFQELEMLEQRLSNISSSKRSKHIKSIHDRFLSSSSDKEVNVSHSSRKLVERERFSKKIDVETSKTVLEFLKRDVCTNLFDSFSRFIQTREYRSWRESKCTSQMINSLDNFDCITDSSNNRQSIDEELTGSVSNSATLEISLSHVSDSTFNTLDPACTIVVEDFNI